MQDINEINPCKFDTIITEFEYKSPIKGGVKDAYHILPKNIAEELFDKLNDIVEMTKICPHCKGRNSKNAVKCSCCGEDFVIVENPPETSSSNHDNDPDITICPFCDSKNPINIEKCCKCGKWIYPKKLILDSIEEFLKETSNQSFKLQKVEFKLPTTQTLQAVKFRFSTLTTGYNPKIRASIQGEKFDLTVKSTEKVDVNELSDIIQRLSNLVQEDVVTTIKFDYEEGIDVSLLLESFKGLKAFDKEIDFKIEILTS